MYLSTFFALTLVGFVKSNTRVDVTLSASGLPNMDLFDGAADPYAIVSYSFSPENQYIQIGQTQYFNDMNDCDWPEVFTFDYVSPGSEQRVKIDVMDSDFDEDDDIGYVEFFLQDLVNAFGNVIVRNITGVYNQGLLTIRARVNQTSVGTPGLESNPEKIVQSVSIDPKL